MGNVIKNGGKAGASVFQLMQRFGVEAKTKPSSRTGNQCKIFPSGYYCLKMHKNLNHLGRYVVHVVHKTHLSHL